MRNIRLISAAAAVATLTIVAPAMAGGYIWISAEFSTPFGTPPKIWRYNIGTGMVDYSIKPTVGGNDLDPNADVYNNLATDGTNLFVGGDDDTVFAICDRLTGVCSAQPGYQPPPNGSFEDGAYRASTGTLYRMDIAGNRLLESDTTGNVLSNRAIIGDPLYATGLEYIGDQAYGTGLDLATFGKLNLINGAQAQFVNIPLIGLPAGHITGGLAYDADTALLYMVTIAISTDGNNHLWTVDPASGVLTHVVKLSDVGYPAAGVNGAGSYILGDAAGWIRTIPEPTTISLLVLGGLCAWRRRRS